MLYEVDLDSILWSCIVETCACTRFSICFFHDLVGKDLGRNSPVDFAPLQSRKILVGMSMLRCSQSSTYGIAYEAKETVAVRRK